jgi:hypothetical protein
MGHFHMPKGILAGLFLLLLLLPGLARAGGQERCAACGIFLNGKCYTCTDQVTQDKVFVCTNCEVSAPACFFCGVPVNTNDCERLPDGRVLCAREARSAILNDKDAARVCDETRDALGRLLSRFLDLPATNIAVDVIDRVHLQELFKFAGRDATCPNVWGYIETSTNGNHLAHQMSLLDGLPLDDFRATCAHELGHAWLNENLPPGRKKTLSRDANEGFCELLAYLLMRSESKERNEAQILRNAYTRGQIQLFIAAEKEFGFNDVLEWMRYGADGRLQAGAPARIHELSQPARRPEAAIASASAKPVKTTHVPAPPATLKLKAVFWSETHPTAMINNATLGPGEEGKVRLGESNILVRCVSVQRDSVRIQVQGELAPRDLALPK